MIPEDAIWILELIRNRDARTEAEKDAVNAAIEALKAQSQQGTTKDAISRQAAIDIERNATVDTNPSHFEAHQKFTQFMDDAEILSFGRWQWSNGFNTALTAVGIDLKKLPPVQPEPQEGHWIPVHPIQSDDPGAYMCSECENGMWEIRPSSYHYCPHCGAKMTISTK